ncbi:unnamed protein product [Tilletia caries]|uniref:Uncharacterized protein n=1 Tax=Tilletia caries TaxID=13290 RepID=A0ABN7INR4_9BASI|nr:unnamed protein product [Tilletia caries]CAD6958717.1 unnamed protein product [Tilletia caries]CAD7062696.1 unnamed protein product [Tilletia caries]
MSSFPYEDDDDDADTDTVTDYHGQSQNQHRAEREAGIEEVNELFAQLSVDVPKLRFLQTILRVLDVPTDEIPETITQCRVMLATIHVVIWDIVGPLQSTALLGTLVENFEARFWRIVSAVSRVNGRRARICGTCCGCSLE